VIQAVKRSFPKFVDRLNAAGLKEEVEAHARAHRVSLQDLYEGPYQAPSVVAARRAVYRWLAKNKKKGTNEIARLFDRARSGVVKFLNNEGA
jgi:hypothetical protein